LHPCSEFVHKFFIKDKQNIVMGPVVLHDLPKHSGEGSIIFKTHGN
jgi:hypothetical protein